MIKAKWVHKWVRDVLNCKSYCGVVTYKNGNQRWSKVTCPKCLAKKPKQKSKDYMSFEMDGKIFVTERKGDGTLISQEEIDGEVVLKCLVSLLEQGMRQELWGKNDQKNNRAK